MDIDKLERLFLAVRYLRKAERKSKEFCDEIGKSPNPSAWLKHGWTKAAIERDRCFEYAQTLARDFFQV